MFSVCKAKNSKTTINNSGFNMFLTVNGLQDSFLSNQVQTQKNLLYFDSFTIRYFMLPLLEIPNKMHIIIYFTKFWENCHKQDIVSAHRIL